MAPALLPPDFSLHATVICGGRLDVRWRRAYICVCVSPLYVVVFGNVVTAFKALCITFEIETGPLSKDLVAE